VRIVYFLRRWTTAAVLVVLAAGCGSSPATVIRSPTTTPPAPTAPAIPSATATASATATGRQAQQITVTPATGLTSGQRVRVQASGFSPGESLVITQCASKGTATGPGDCNLNAMQGVTADADGRVQADFTVTKGPFGANNIVCGPAQACLMSVTQATPSPTQEADAQITFGLPGPE
jgi:Neocarzinostatin family